MVAVSGSSVSCEDDRREGDGTGCAGNCCGVEGCKPGFITGEGVASGCLVRVVVLCRLWDPTNQIFYVLSPPNFL